MYMYRRIEFLQIRNSTLSTITLQKMQNKGFNYYNLFSYIWGLGKFGKESVFFSRYERIRENPYWEGPRVERQTRCRPEIPWTEESEATALGSQSQA